MKVKSRGVALIEAAVDYKSQIQTTDSVGTIFSSTSRIASPILRVGIEAFSRGCFFPTSWAAAISSRVSEHILGKEVKISRYYTNNSIRSLHSYSWSYKLYKIYNDKRKGNIGNQEGETQ